MNEGNLTDWLVVRLASGGKIVLLECYANHIVVGVLCTGQLLVALKKAADATDYIIGMGFKLSDKVPIEEPVTIQAQETELEKAPVCLTVPLGNYHGPVDLLLTASKHHSRTFTVCV